jgi:DNA invertase Pin-like site-specific DNA recombinase
MQQKYYRDKEKVEVLWNQDAIQKQTFEENIMQRNLRVAAYCRVSTNLDKQIDSFELQEKHYTRLIEQTPGWRLTGIYADEGITGTQRNKRIGFQRLIRHCEEGKIDRILCKSISRFARNTMDLLETVRRLKELNISVIFEKEGIDTLSVQSEFLLSTIAAIAQEESRSISENMTWAFKKRFQSGVPIFHRILGYDVEGKGDNMKIKVNKQGRLVQICRKLYLHQKRNSNLPEEPVRATNREGQRKGVRLLEVQRWQVADLR